jgi:hypothetical protein
MITLGKILLQCSTQLGLSLPADKEITTSDKRILDTIRKLEKEGYIERKEKTAHLAATQDEGFLGPLPERDVTIISFHLTPAGRRLWTEGK